MLVPATPVDPRCPNTAWLLFLSFCFAIVAFVAVGVWLSKKRINLAGMSIGVVRAGNGRRQT